MSGILFAVKEDQSIRPPTLPFVTDLLSAFIAEQTASDGYVTAAPRKPTRFGRERNSWRKGPNEEAWKAYLALVSQGEYGDGMIITRTHLSQAQQ
jgi:hypothetical protein